MSEVATHSEGLNDFLSVQQTTDMMITHQRCNIVSVVRRAGVEDCEKMMSQFY